MGPNIYSKEYLKRKLDKIPDDIYNDSLNTTWNENVDEKLQKALADIRTNVSNEDYNKTKKEFDYEEYSKERWDYVKSLADSNMKDDIDNNALLEIDAKADASGTTNIYAVNYNVLRIMSGMGGLAYSN